jgi:hypothetical protein
MVRNGSPEQIDVPLLTTSRVPRVEYPHPYPMYSPVAMTQWYYRPMQGIYNSLTTTSPNSSMAVTSRWIVSLVVPLATTTLKNLPSSPGA